MSNFFKKRLADLIELWMLGAAKVQAGIEKLRGRKTAVPEDKFTSNAMELGTSWEAVASALPDDFVLSSGPYVPPDLIDNDTYDHAVDATATPKLVRQLNLRTGVLSYMTDTEVHGWVKIPKWLQPAAAKYSQVSPYDHRTQLGLWYCRERKKKGIVVR